MYEGVTAGGQGELGESPPRGELMFEPLIHQATALLGCPQAKHQISISCSATEPDL